MSMSQPPPQDIIGEGLARAKNMAVAAFMICFLLAKFVAVKVIWKRLERMIAWVVVKTAVALSVVYEKLRPHWERFKRWAMETRIKVFRLVLGTLITLITPVEEAMLRGFGKAKERSEHMALVSASSAINVIVPIFQAMGTVFRQGFSKPAVQKMLNKLFEVLEEAQK